MYAVTRKSLHYRHITVTQGELYDEHRIIYKTYNTIITQKYNLINYYETVKNNILWLIATK